MHTYDIQTFEIPPIEGISKKQIDAHLALYEGYVKHANILVEEVMKLHNSDNPNKHYLMKELWRRYGFEFDGMRSHEYYFNAVVRGPQALNTESKLGKKVTEWVGSYEELENILKFVTGTRGSGWTLLVYDKHQDFLEVVWVDEHHLGHLSSVDIILAIDCWEHAYMIDHDTTGRGAYVESYLAAINWSVPEKWFDEVVK